jgi:DNA repair exonuclease SbcCD ATPase subunit
MRLKSLTLSNFKGVKNFTFTPYGQNVTVRGDNATGKTTLYDGVLFLLFDKDSLGQKQFEIKTLDVHGAPVHGLEHGVEATFDLNGAELTLRKVLSEIWTKRRGTATKELTGNKTECWIDGVPVKATDYKAKISEIADESLFRLLTNPKYFSEGLQWRERRAMLLQAFGDVHDADVIDSDPELAPLVEIMGRRSLEDCRKVLEAQRRKLNDELQQIPTRIDEVGRSLPELTRDADTLAVELDEEIRRRKHALHIERDELSRIESGGEIAEQTKKLREVEGKIQTARNAQVLDEQRVSSAHYSELRKLSDELAEIESEARDWGRTIQAKRKGAEALRNEVDDIRQRWYKVDAETFTPPTQPDTCPACGQAIPQERIEAVTAAALAEFNESKAKRLEALRDQGRAKMAEAEKAEESINGLLAQEGACKTRLDAARKALEQKKGEPVPQVAKRPEINALELEADAIKASIAALASDAEKVAAPLRESIASQAQTIAEIERELANVDNWRRGQDRIAELSKEERRLAKEYEQTEAALILTERFIRAKVSMLSDKINGHFKLVRFKLFEEQINGGLAECCEMTVGGVPYGSLNNAARLQGGLDIINALSERHEFRPMIFIDNAEAVTSLPQLKAQTIALYVDPTAKTLQVSNELRVAA